MKYISKFVLYLTSSLLFLLFISVFSAADSYAQLRAPMAYQGPVGDCPYASCPSTSSCGGTATGTGNVNTPATYDEDGDGKAETIYCVDSVRQCAYEASCPTSGNTSQTCGTGAYTDSTHRKRINGVSGYTHVTCNVGSVCDGGPNTADAYWCITAVVPTNTPTKTPTPPPASCTAPNCGAGSIAVFKGGPNICGGGSGTQNNAQCSSVGGNWCYSSGCCYICQPISNSPTATKTPTKTPTPGGGGGGTVCNATRSNGQSCDLPCECISGQCTGTVGNKTCSGPTPTSGGSNPTATRTPTRTPTQGAPTGCSGSACGRVTHCSTGAGLSGVSLGVSRDSGNSWYALTTNSTGYYTGGVNPSDSVVKIRVNLSGSSYAYDGWTAASPSTGLYTGVPRGSTRNFTICPPPSGPTATPTRTPTPPASNMVVQVRQRLSNGSTTPLSGSQAALYEQTALGALIYKGSATTNSLGIGTWTGLTGGTYGYRITLADKGPGRSTWTIYSPTSGINYWSNVPAGSSRTFVLQEPAATPTPTTPAGTPYTVDGRILTDHNNDNTCEVGSPELAGTTITLNRSDGTQLNTVNGQGYNFSGNTNTSLTHILSVVNNTPPGYSVIGVRNGTSGAFTSHTSSSYPVNLQADPTQTIYFCMKPTTASDTPWFMTSVGSVRQQRISNPVPDGKSPTTGTTDASVFYSTAGIAFLGEATGTKWKVDEEYDEVPALDRPGNASYSFYTNRAGTTGTQMYTLTSPVNVNLDTLVPNRVYHVDGDLTVNANSAINGKKRFVFLANGDIRINGSVTVNHPDALVVFAAKDDIIIGPTVGGAANSTAYHIQAILTAENDIIVESSPATCPTSDLRLNIEGSLVANSDNPFGRDTNGGVLNNRRNLCASNADYPSLFVKSRLSFITELSDFYKVSSRFWNEIAP